MVNDRSVKGHIHLAMQEHFSPLLVCLPISLCKASYMAKVMRNSGGRITSYHSKDWLRHEVGATPGAGVV